MCLSLSRRNGRRSPLLFWRFTASIWSDQLSLFGRDRRVIAIDPRSQGDSTKTAEGDTPEQRARDLHTVLEKMGVGRRVLVGWSQGVQDAAAYVLQFGISETDGIVLVDATISAGANGISAAPGAAAQQLGLLPLLSDSPRDYTIGMMKAVITRSLEPLAIDRLVNEALKTPTAVGEAMLVADLFGRDRRPAIAKMNLPVLIIASSRSSELAEQKAMASKMPNGRFEVVENAGHAVFVDQPDQFNALLRNFLTRLKPPALPVNPDG